MGQSYREAREILAGKDFVTTILKPEPKYMGEAIPISGNGDVTTILKALQSKMDA